MGIGITLKKLIEDRNTTVAEISKATGVKSTTIYSIIDRDSKSANISDLYKIAHFLGVTLDYFYDRTVDDEIHISEHEKALIKAYRSQPTMQEAVDRLLGLPAADSFNNIVDDAVNTVNAISSAVSRQECKK